MLNQTTKRISGVILGLSLAFSVFSASAASGLVTFLNTNGSMSIFQLKDATGVVSNCFVNDSPVSSSANYVTILAIAKATGKNVAYDFCDPSYGAITLVLQK